MRFKYGRLVPLFSNLEYYWKLFKYRHNTSGRVAETAVGAFRVIGYNVRELLFEVSMRVRVGQSKRQLRQMGIL